MLNLSATIRKDFGKKTKSMKNAGKIPAVVYGPKTKNVAIEIDEKEFRKVFQKAGESSLIEVNLDKEKKPVLVHDIQKDPVSDKVIHIDFFQPDLTEKVEVEVPLVFEGTSLAEKDLGGVLNKNILEITVKALPQDLPHEIRVNIESLKTFQDHIYIKDLAVPAGVEIMKSADEIVAAVLPPRNIEEELAQEIKEDVEGVEKVEKEKKEEDVVEEPKGEAPKKEEAK